MNFHSRALLLTALLAAAVSSLSCPSKMDDVNVREALPGGVDYSFVVWRIDLPEILPAGRELEVPVELINNGLRAWESEPGKRFRLSYHWKHPGGRLVADMFFGEQTPLPAFVFPGEMLKLDMHIKTPETPKFYDIVIDIVRVETGREHDRQSAFWFEEHDKRKKQAFDRRVEVVAYETP
jgi:hypothetical protein